MKCQFMDFWPVQFDVTGSKRLCHAAELNARVREWVDANPFLLLIAKRPIHRFQSAAPHALSGRHGEALRGFGTVALIAELQK